MDTLKIVIIGAGWVALHRHLPSIRQQPQAEVTGIIDRTTENARTAAASHGITNYASIENGFETPWFRDCSICCVATPPQTHYSLVKRCLEAGKDVITEKPFVMSHAEADDLQTCARNKARILAIVHNFQFSRSASQLLSDIENKELGNIISVEGIQFSNPRRRLPRWYNALPGGLFFDESPHLLYMIDRLCKNELKLRSVMSLP
ncbi:MAG TPA: Gfo/Idh/MocA family oxidoreductase, partial [Oligoflexia bacterium]|nr:Gfo/Idh/MocA family oxidoreductase [Oligoflexia bacterium]